MQAIGKQKEEYNLVVLLHEHTVSLSFKMILKNDQSKNTKLFV